MPVNLSIKNVPDSLAERLRERAKRHHRSLQGELMAILEEAESGARTINTEPAQMPRSIGRMGSVTIEELSESARKSGLRSPSEAARLVREDRDRDAR